MCVCVCVCVCVCRKKLRSSPELSFGNSVYQIRFEQKDEFPLFGHSYSFYLEESIDNCVEYVSHFGVLQRFAVFCSFIPPRD